MYFQICEGCGRRRELDHHLCAVCWFRLPAETQDRLMLKDDHRDVRDMELLEELQSKVPFRKIKVSQ